MTRQTWTAFVAAACFVTLAVLVAVLPVPFVTWSPGGTRDALGTVETTSESGKTVTEPMISITDIETFPTTGQLDLAIVSSTAADARLTLPEALAAYWLPDRDTLPREVVFPPSKSPDEVEREETQMMETAQDDAVVAALREADQEVTEMPMVASVTVGGPANQRLLPGDLIAEVDGVEVSDAESVRRQIRSHRPGEEVDFVVLRNRVRTEVSVTAVSSTVDPATAVVGITVEVGYSYTPRITFDLGQEIGGYSAGLVFAIAIYDKITDGPLLDGRHVAGTGRISPEGQVGAIGGIQQKIAAAEEAGATAFLVPAPNCGDLEGLRTDLTLIRVAALNEAVEAMRTLDEPGGAARTPRCP